MEICLLMFQFLVDHIDASRIIVEAVTVAIAIAIAVTVTVTVTVTVAGI